MAYFAYNTLNNYQYNNYNNNNTYTNSNTQYNASPLRYNEFNSPIREEVNEDNFNDDIISNNNYNANEDINQPTDNLTQEFQNILREILRQARERDNSAIYQYIVENCINQLYFNEIENPINSECPILQTDFEEDDVVVQLNKCSHIFTADAIKNWFKNNHTCPVCRCNVIEDTEFTRNRSYAFYF